MENSSGKMKEKAVRWFVSLFYLFCLGLIIQYASGRGGYTLNQ